MRPAVADRSAIDRRVEAVEARELEQPVRYLLGDPAARVTAWAGEPVGYDFLNPSSGGVYRFSGTAERRGGSVAWRLVLKVTRAVEGLERDPPLPPAAAAELAAAVRWDRELLAYESGLLAALDGPLVAPRSYGATRLPDGTAWLWLEDLGAEEGPWPLDRYGALGRALGAFDGGFLGRGDVPAYDWLGRRWLRTWTTVVTPHELGSFLDAAAWERPAARAAYPADVQRRLLSLWSERERLLRAVEALPSTVSHLDAHRRNLFARGDRLVAIDWGLLGLAAPGEEIASTLVGTVASGELPAARAGALAALLYEGYLEGLRDAGVRAREREVRLGFAAAAGLRSLSILGLDSSDERRLRECATLARTLLRLGEEALELLEPR